jgi:acyl-CoA synthetase (AMP-forming)/AMP-acid ligase II
MQLTRSLTRARRIAADRTALVYADRRRTWSEFEARVARLAGAMRALGVGAGDRVILLGHSSDRFLECFYATLWAGGVIAPLSTRATPDELDYLFGDLDATLFLVGDGFESGGRALARRQRRRAGRSISASTATPDGFLDYETILRDAAPIADAGRRGDDTAAIFYTGGTTGRPKGVMLTHTNMLSNALNGLHHLGLVGRPGQPARRAALPCRRRLAHRACEPAGGHACRHPALHRRGGARNDRAPPRANGVDGADDDVADRASPRSWRDTISPACG